MTAAELLWEAWWALLAAAALALTNLAHGRWTT